MLYNHKQFVHMAIGMLLVCSSYNSYSSMVPSPQTLIYSDNPRDELAGLLNMQPGSLDNLTKNQIEQHIRENFTKKYASSLKHRGTAREDVDFQKKEMHIFNLRDAIFDEPEDPSKAIWQEISNIQHAVDDLTSQDKVIPEKFDKLINNLEKTFLLINDLFGSNDTLEKSLAIGSDITNKLNSIKEELTTSIAGPTADLKIKKLKIDIISLENYNKSLSKQLQKVFNLSGINEGAFGFVVSPISRRLDTLLAWAKKQFDDNLNEAILKEADNIKLLANDLTNVSNLTAKGKFDYFGEIANHFEKTVTLFNSFFRSNDTLEATQMITRDARNIINSIKKELTEFITNPTADYNNIVRLDNSIKLLENYAKSLVKQFPKALMVSDDKKSMFESAMSSIIESLSTLLVWAKVVKATKEKEIAAAENAMATEQEQPIASAPTQKPVGTRAMAGWYKKVLGRLKGTKTTPTQQTVTESATMQGTKQQPPEGLVEWARRNFWSMFGYK